MQGYIVEIDNRVHCTLASKDSGSYFVFSLVEQWFSVIQNQKSKLAEMCFTINMYFMTR
jgi:hypothetical protein